MDRTMADAALEYATVHGIAVHPLRPRMKEPASTRGFKDATLDAEEIERTWAQRPDMNVGGAMGQVSGGVCCIDLDVDASKGLDGREVLLDWEAEHGKLPDTATAITGRGGLHLFYRFGHAVKPSVNEELGVDVRGDGSYAMLAPSVHPNGRTVEWELSPDEVGFADATPLVEEFVGSVRPAGHSDGGQFEKKVDVNAPVKKGGRNNGVFKKLCAARSMGADDDVMEVFAATFNSMLEEPLDDGELSRILASVLRYEPGNKDIEKRINAEEKAASEGKPAPQPRPRFKHNEFARRLMDERGACFIDGMPAVRDGGRYRTGWNAVDAAIISMKDDATKANQSEVRHYLTVKAPRISQSRPTLVGFENGVLDVETMELRDYREDDVIPNVIPHRWNPWARSATVDSTFRKLSCGDPGLEMNLAEVIGLCMYRNSRHYPYCPVLLGRGSNGKSTYISMLRSVVGDENMAAMQPREIGQRFQAAHLVGKLANLGDDISNDYIDGDGCAVIKKVATGDVLYTDVKGGEGFTFTPYATMVFSANKFPRLGDNSDGMMRRLFPVSFKARFSKSDPDFDPRIADKLAAEDAVEYLCAIGVEGLRRVIANGSLTANCDSERMAHDIKVDNDTVLQWTESEDVKAEDVCGKTNAEAYDGYREWCGLNGFQAVNSRKFAAKIGDVLGVALNVIDHVTSCGKRKTVKKYGLAR